MPNIEKQNREKFEKVLQEFKASISDMTAGDLNYLISRMIWHVFDVQKSYNSANALMGVLECIKQEFYRRKVAPYEDQKIKENGDIQ